MIYGLDLSMSKIGVAILDDDKNFIASKLLKPKASLSHGDKLHFYKTELQKLLGEYEPTIIMIERGFTRFNKTTQVQFRVHGVINMLFRRYKQVYVSPTEAKKMITGRGNASKKEVIKSVEKRIGIKLSEDESDAYAVALCADI